MKSYYKLLIVILSLVLFLEGASCKRRHKKKKPIKISGARCFYYHKFSKSDTIFRLSKMYAVNIETLLKINKIHDPTKIRNGKLIYIPGKPELLLARRYHYYKQRGEKAPDFVYIIKSSNSSHSTSGIKKFHVKPKQRPVLKSKKVLPYKSKSKPASRKKTYRKSLTHKFTPPSNEIKKLKSKTIWPMKGKVISNFGSEINGAINEGIDIISSYDKSVKAILDGTVEYAGNDLKGYGNTIILYHSGDYYSLYSHLNKITVIPGQKVNRGKTIGIPSLKQKGYFLHFQIRKGVNPFNPLIILP